MNQPAGPAATRIGVFGGAFDPPHNAHVALAGAALAQFGLDALHVIPTGLAWHKARALSPAQDRLAMARLAFAPLPRVVVDDREVRRAGPTFTIDTLEALQRENPQAQLYLFMGGDQFAAFRQWHRWQDILRLAIICIADRADPALHGGLFDGHLEASEDLTGRILTLELPLMAVSATRIRQDIAALAATGAAPGPGGSSLVPGPVARYISEHGLYAPV